MHPGLTEDCPVGQYLSPGLAKSNPGIRVFDLDYTLLNLDLVGLAADYGRITQDCPCCNFCPRRFNLLGNLGSFSVIIQA